MLRSSLGLLALVLLSACSATKAGPPAMASARGAGGSELAAAAPVMATESAGAARASVDVAPSLPVARPSRGNEAGLLTAGIWDDNRNFDFFRPYAAAFARDNGDDFAMFGPAELDAARHAAEHASPKRELDLQLVLDTTGSMGDELAYLQTEIGAIVSRLHERFPAVAPRLSLVVYRDEGDAYVTRDVDFTGDVPAFRRALRAQSAGGGGDEPEAVVAGLSKGLAESWRRGPDVARVAFWVADAPAHPGEGRALAQVLRTARDRGVHFYPIASSDSSPAAEYQMRSAAQLTGGRYLFLTNDSGIGNDHAEPHIPCYDVTRLDAAMLRVIESEMTGRHVAPAEGAVLRSVGKPSAAGTCTLPSGLLVASY